MARHLILNLESPLMSFGGETIDNLGIIRPFPAVSMLTGLLANALGWRRIERQRHQTLQDRLVFAARIDREPYGGLSMTDYQTALLYQDDRGWTSRGQPEGRAKSPSYTAVPPETRKSLTQQRYRDYHTDMRVTVALRLYPADGDPMLEELAEKLKEPERPLFIGRKPCLPSSPLFGGFSEGESSLEALLSVPLTGESPVRTTIRVQWPEGETAPKMEPDFGQARMITDERNWISGLHGGGRPIRQAAIQRDSFGPTPPQEGGQL